MLSFFFIILLLLLSLMSCVILIDIFFHCMFNIRLKQIVHNLRVEYF